MWEVIGIALTAIIGFIVAFFVLLYSLSGGMRKAAHGFLNALDDKDYAKAYEYLSDHIKREVWFEDFERYLYERYMTDFSEYRYSDFNVAADGSNGEFKTNLILNTETIVPLTMRLMKFKRKWKIYSIDIQIRVTDSYLKNNITDINTKKKSE